MTPHAKVVKLNSEKEKAANLRTIYRMRSFKLIYIWINCCVNRQRSLLEKTYPYIDQYVFMLLFPFLFALRISLLLFLFFFLFLFFVFFFHYEEQEDVPLSWQKFIFQIFLFWLRGRIHMVWDQKFNRDSKKTYPKIYLVQNKLSK